MLEKSKGEKVKKVSREESELLCTLEYDKIKS
ncbi:hypothetical protein CLV99_3874 [Sphingobacterium yanglingense]|uniref:Uncharacterized protein n=1 Tax=Sphingobacterium yanglingense TaxID=1437280 RepID=A0A4R6WBZ5_9SPHI|nr:hypothetical protein CLV99_3874 [Sphingobacterium yanglingense]